MSAIDMNYGPPQLTLMPSVTEEAPLDDRVDRPGLRRQPDRDDLVVVGSAWPQRVGAPACDCHFWLSRVQVKRQQQGKVGTPCPAPAVLCLD